MFIICISIILKIYPFHPLRSQGKFSLLSARRFSWCSFGEFGIGSTNNFSLFSSLVCLMSYWYCEEKFCLGHMWELKADQNISNNCVSMSFISKRSAVTSISPSTPTSNQHRTSPKKISFNFSATERKNKQPYQVENVYLTQHQVTREYIATRGGALTL